MTRRRYWLAAVLLLVATTGSSVAGGTSARLPGDFRVGALFSVHDPPSGWAQGALACGAVRELYGIQRVETALWTLDRINNSTEILPGVTLGLETRDSCWSAPVALQQTLQLVIDSIVPAHERHEQRHEQRNRPAPAPAAQQPKRKNGHGEPVGEKEPLIGVVGPGSSSVVLQVQNLLQLFSIPQIGYSSTSRDLSDKSRFSTFLRVVPSDQHQAQLLVDLVRHLNWTYLSIVNTDENYGISGIQAFRELAEKTGVCIAGENAILSQAEPQAYERLLSHLEQERASRVIVCFCEGQTVRNIFLASQRMNLTGRFVIVGSDGWADRENVVSGVEEEAWGGISIRIHSPRNYEFDEYYLALRPESNARDPWFREFWQAEFKCGLPWLPAHDPGHKHRASYPANCSGLESIKPEYRQDPKMNFVMKSLWVMAHGLHNMLESVCGPNYRGVCPQMLPFNNALFLDFLLNVTFAWDDEVVEFDRRGDPPGRYEILNYQRMPNGSYGYVQIGEGFGNGSWSLGRLPQSRHSQLVESVCSRPCPPDKYKDFKSSGKEKKCCWSCSKCDPYHYVNESGTGCARCAPGSVPNANHTGCDSVPIEFIQWTDPEAMLTLGTSGLGLAATLVTCLIFLRHNNTPVVKASTRELSYIILAGIALAHLSIFSMIGKPTALSCLLARVLPGVSFAMIFASLCTKTNRIARILAGSKKRFPTRKPRFMSAIAQILITCTMIAVESVVVAVSLRLDPGEPATVHPRHDHSILACPSTPRAVLTPLAFDALLIGLCTLYAVKTRNVPENFNEAKFIGFAMYTICVIWVAWVCIYFGSEYKVITMCLCVTLSGTVTLIFLFMPKLYIIVLRPERNNRALFTTSKSIRCHIGARVAAAIAEPPPKNAAYRLSSLSAEGTTDSSTKRIKGPSVKSRTLSIQTDQELLLSLCRTLVGSPPQRDNDREAPPTTENDLSRCADFNLKDDDFNGDSNDSNEEGNEVCEYCYNEGINRVARDMKRPRISLPVIKNLQTPEPRNKQSKMNGGSDWAQLDVRQLFNQPRSLREYMENPRSTVPRYRAKYTKGPNDYRNVKAQAAQLIKKVPLKSETFEPRIIQEKDQGSTIEDPLLNITITLGESILEGLK